MAATRMDEALGTRAVLRYCRMSAFKVRPVLDLIRGRDLEELRFLALEHCAERRTVFPTNGRPAQPVRDIGCQSCARRHP